MLQQKNKLQKFCRHLIYLVVISTMMIPWMPLQKIVCSGISFHCHSTNAPQIKLNPVLFSTELSQLTNKTQKCDLLEDLFQKDPNTTTSCCCSTDVPLSGSNPPIARTPIQRLQYISVTLHSPVMVAPTQQPKPTFQDASSTFQSIELSTVVLTA